MLSVEEKQTQVVQAGLKQHSKQMALSTTTISQMQEMQEMLIVVILMSITGPRC